MPNDSSTGGPLQPTGSPSTAPLESVGLLDFLQQWLVNLSGLDGTLVRPAFQTEPPNIPDAGVAWMAFTIKDRKSDTYPAVQHISTSDGRDVLHRHETFTLLCSTYDTGSTGLADQIASLVRDNSAIAQNREYLETQRCALIAVGDLLQVPTLVKQNWLNRIDLEIVLRREILRDYAVLNVLEGVGTIQTDSDGYSTHFDTPVVPTPP